MPEINDSGQKREYFASKLATQFNAAVRSAVATAGWATMEIRQPVPIARKVRSCAPSLCDTDRLSWMRLRMPAAL